MKRLLAAIALALLCSSPAVAPAGSMMLLGAGLFNSYSIPTLNGLACGWGDSEIANSGGTAWTASTFTATMGGGAGYLGLIGTKTNNRVGFQASSIYAVGNTTALRLADSLPSNRYDTGQASLTASVAATTLTATAASVTGLRPNTVISGTGVTAGTVVGANGTATSDGTTIQAQGTYAVSPSQMVASTTIAATNNPAFATTGFGADKTWNFLSTGQYSALSDPCVTPIVLVGTNDPSSALTETQDFAALSSIADVAGPAGGTINGSPVSGANKFAFWIDMIPRGIGFIEGETHTQATTTYTVAQGGFFESDDCDTNIVPHVIAANYAVTAGVGLATNGTNTLLTKVGSSPNDGQYTVSAGGLYTFSTSLSIIAPQLTFNYCYNSQARTGSVLNWLLDQHAWVNSSAAVFTGPASGTNLVVPGLLTHPGVRAIAAWDAIAGPTAATTGLNKAGTLADGLHPASWGSQLLAAAAATSINAIVPNVPLIIPPTANNYYIIKGSGLVKTYTSTTAPLPPNMIPQLSGLAAGGLFQVCYQQACEVAGAAVSGQGTFAWNGLTSTTSSITGASGGCINYTAGSTCNGSTAAGAYSLPNFSANIPVNGRVIAYSDPPFNAAGAKASGNLFFNGQMDYFVAASGGGAGTLTNLAGSTCNTANSGLSNSNYVPSGWVLTGDANTQTALGAGTLVMTCGYGTAPDGAPGFFLTLYGKTAATSALTMVESVQDVGSFLSTATPDMVRSYVRITAVAGPGGHLYGVQPPNIKINTTVTTAGSVFGVNCPTTNCNILSGKAGDTAGSLTDVNLLDFGATAEMFDYSTPLTSTTNDLGAGAGPVTANALTISPSPIINQAIDVKLWFENAAERILPK